MHKQHQWLSMEDLHRLLFLLLSVSDNVWLAVGVKLHQSLVGPISDELGSSPILVGLLLQSVELRREVINLGTLLLDLGLALLEVCLDDVIVAELVFHLDLCASALAARLQDVYASTLGGYDESKDGVVTLKNIKNGLLTADVDGAAEGLGDLRVELNHEVSLVRELVVALLDCLGDPLPERLPDHRVDYINDPLPR